MERLTRRDEYGNANIIALSDIMPELYAGLSFSETNAMTDALNKLADYEDAEENGILIKLPCKVGDYLYTIWEGMYGYEVGMGYIQELRIHRDNKICAYVGIDPDEEEEWEIDEDVYFTREEAEKALKERESE